VESAQRVVCGVRRRETYWKNAYQWAD
jgi:hypothetical protein